MYKVYFYHHKGVILELTSRFPAQLESNKDFNAESIHSICYCHPDNSYLSWGLNRDIINVNCVLGL